MIEFLTIFGTVLLVIIALVAVIAPTLAAIACLTDHDTSGWKPVAAICWFVFLFALILTFIIYGELHGPLIQPTTSNPTAEIQSD